MAHFRNKIFFSGYYLL